MFEDLFGLTKRPFGSQTAGADVFIGPQTAGLITRAKKVFAEPDAVVCVSGPVGSGKTTIVARALSALGRQHTVINIGRIKLGPDEVIEFLLRELGLKQMPAGTIQKLTVFRSLLKKFAENDIRLFVIVEDATRLGNVALAELEALTATDAGVSDGANLVLMSEESLKENFRAPGLARLRQRSRLHYELKALTPPEVRGYLTHGLRQAGGDIAAIIDDDAVLAIHVLSEGIPRVINNLVNSSLEAVADKKLKRLARAQVADVAASEFGLEVPDLDATIAKATAAAPAAPKPEAPPVKPKAPPKAKAPDSNATQQTPAPEIAAEAPAAPVDAASNDEQTQSNDGPELIQDTLPEVEALSSGEYPIPELIQDTLPDLEVLSPALAETARDEAAAEPSEEPEPPLIQDTVPDLPVLEDPAVRTAPVEPRADAPSEPAPADDDIPTLFDSSPRIPSPAATARKKPAAAEPPVPEPAAEPPTLEPAKEEVPAWDRDPTMAELKPDLEALEHAMAVAQGLGTDDKNPPAPPAATKPEEVPEITLDESIRRKIDIAEVALQATQSLDLDINPEDSATVPTLESTIAGDKEKESTRADEELERIATELAKAKTIEDVDDRMAETLFGEEINLIAAEFAANAPDPAPEPEPEPAPDAVAPAEEELSLMATNSNLQSPAVETPGSPDTSDLEREFREVYGEDALEVSIEAEQPPGGMDLSASQRLATVRALNAGTMPSGSGATNKPVGRPAGPAPEPIEDQINTSITQTLKTLKAQDIPPAEEPEEEGKSGFFSRFRKS